MAAEDVMAEMFQDAGDFAAHAGRDTICGPDMVLAEVIRKRHAPAV